MRGVTGLRRVGESGLRRLADLFADDRHPVDPADVSVDATIVFADIEGFSDLVAHEGDDVAVDILDRLDRAVDQALSETNARLVKRLGDGVMISASDPDEGIRVSAGLPVAFATQMQDLPHHLRLRVGAHRGFVRQRGTDLIGYHVNVAARVAEAAPGDVVYVTDDVLRDAHLPVTLVARPVGRLIAKGVPARPQVHRIEAQ